MAQTKEAALDSRELNQSMVNRVFVIIGVYLIAIFLIILGIILQLTGVINNFLSGQNMLNIVDAVSMLGIVAVGMAFVTYSGHYADLSVPTTMALTGIIAVEMLKYGFLVAVIIAFSVGIVVGIINAIAIGKFRANPIIWTLAVNYMTMGVIRLVWVNKQIYPDMTASTVRASELFDAIFRFRFVGKIALPMIMMIVLVIVLQFVMRKTKFGVQLKMTGAARTPAKFSGVNVELMIGIAFIICAVTATIGGLTVTSLNRVGAWYNGAGYDFKAVTAVVIGGVTLAGGRGAIIGVLGGVLVIGILNNILTLLGVGTFSQDMIRGAIFIVVVFINARSLRKMGRDYE
jgi:ribose/xylose/arabinose/galactoside ABC-type transport system permease subunit